MQAKVCVLNAPPSQAPFWLRTAGFWEGVGRHLPWLSGGVLMVEATKQVYAPTRGGLGAVVFSNHAHPVVRSRCLNLGAVAFFDKSFQTDELLEFVQRAAEKRPG